MVVGREVLVGLEHLAMEVTAVLPNTYRVARGRAAAAQQRVLAVP